MRYNFLLLSSFLLMLLTNVNAQTKLSELNAEAVLATIEKAADWQLSNPVRFDVTYKKDNEVKQARILWEGLTAKTRDYSSKERDWGNVPDDWKYFCELVGEDVNYQLLPRQIKSAVDELNVNENEILTITMGDGISRSWEIGAFFVGLLALSEVSTSDRFIDALKSVAEASKWKLGDRIYHADDHCVGQMYLDLYERYKNIEMMAAVQMQFDWLIKNPHPQSLDYSEGKDRWSWCDALFMSPPVWLKLTNITGDKKYLNYMNDQFWLTYEHLYDKEEHLFYRDDRYCDIREPNGEKIFWSRGNGWVIAGLTLLLNEFPEDYTEVKKYEVLFKEMAEKILSIQPRDGLFRSSLLDVESYPAQEASSTAFFTYALAWGINNGYLEKEKYLPFVLKSWNALMKCVNENGKLGFVQLPGSEPGEVKEDWNATYGTGAFLLAGSEIIKMLDK